MSVVTGGLGGGAVVTFGYGGAGAAYVPPEAPQGLIPFLERVFALKPLLRASMKFQPGAPESLSLIPDLQTLRHMVAWLISALTLAPQVGTEAPGRPSAAAKALIPEVDSKLRDSVDLTAKKLKPQVGAEERDEVAAPDSKNLKPKVG